jgi:hypothetical protein
MTAPYFWETSDIRLRLGGIAGSSAVLTPA